MNVIANVDVLFELDERDRFLVLAIFNPFTSFIKVFNISVVDSETVFTTMRCWSISEILSASLACSTIVPELIGFEP